MHKPLKSDAIDLDELCHKIVDGESMGRIAAGWGVSRSMLAYWIAGSPDRSARVKEARELAAQAWDEMALEGILNADSPFDQAKAKDAAHHYRWRASKIAPQYGDKSTVTHAGAVAHLGAADISETERSFISEQLKRDA
jgi:hypothetical protein